jgi:hypothetical protein
MRKTIKKVTIVVPVLMTSCQVSLYLKIGPVMAVRPEGANHQWRKIPPRELSIDLEADERLGRATGRAGAS